MRALEADRDILHRHLLPQDRVVDAAPHDLAGMWRHWATSVHCDSFTVWPTRSWSTRVGRLFGRIWPSTTSSGSLPAPGHPLAWPSLDVEPSTLAPAVHRYQEEQVGEGEVGQDAPAPEQPLQVLELLWLEIGAAEGQLGGRRHQVTVSPSRLAPSTGHRCRRRDPSDAGTRLPPRPGWPAGRRPGPPRVRGGARPRPWSAAPHAPRIARAAPWPGTARPPACASRPS